MKTFYLIVHLMWLVAILFISLGVGYHMARGSPYRLGARQAKQDLDLGAVLRGAVPPREALLERARVHPPRVHPPRPLPPPPRTADEIATELLLSHLSLEQREMYTKFGYFRVQVRADELPGWVTGLLDLPTPVKTFILHDGYFMIELRDGGGDMWHGLHPQGFVPYWSTGPSLVSDIPLADALLAQLLVLRANPSLLYHACHHGTPHYWERHVNQRVLTMIQMSKPRLMEINKPWHMA